MTPEDRLRDYASGRIAFTLEDVLSETDIPLGTALFVLANLVESGDIRRIDGNRTIYTWEAIL